MCFATYIVRTSLKYSRTSPSSGTRLMLVNQVALGKCCDFSTHQKHLKRAPAGYDSCHGVKAMANNGSDFEVCFYSFFLWVFQRICNHLWVAVDSIAFVLLQHAYMYVKVKDHSLQPSLSSRMTSTPSMIHHSKSWLIWPSTRWMATRRARNRSYPT